MATYRKPGVYLEESPLTGTTDIGIANAVAAFGGAASQGPTTGPVRIDAWNDYVTVFGGFNKPVDASDNEYFSYLPYAVHSFFQNGGRTAYVQRALPAGSGTASTNDVVDTNTDVCFTVTATSVGAWGDSLSVEVVPQQSTGTFVYTLSVIRDGNEVERFSDLSLDGTVQGTKRVDVAVNDEIFGSDLISISAVDGTKTPTTATVALVNGADGDEPTGADLKAAATAAAAEVDGPVLVNAVPLEDSTGTLQLPAVPDPLDATFNNRGDIFVINDAVAPRSSSQSSTAYATDTLSDASSLLLTGNANSSYCASYAPWIVVSDPAVNGGTRLIPPGGAVMGVYSRTDATEGVFRAPAGVLASVNAVGVDAKFSDTTLGQLNSVDHINVLRPVAGSGITIMGARTRKKFGYDRYVSARRTLIYIKESLRNSTQFAVFENNNEQLWTRLRSTADRILRPIWQAGGLRGGSANEAYFIICDDSINTPAVIASGEVRMDIGVSLTAPAEYIVIRLSQYEGGGTDITVTS